MKLKLQNVGSASLASVLCCGFILPAFAQHVNYFWSVVDGSTTLQPGERVTLQLNAERDSGDWYSGGQFTVPISGWGASDVLLTNTNGTFGTENRDDTPSIYLGRKPSGGFPGYRLPGIIGYALQPIGPNGQELISDLPDFGIVHAQAALLNPGDPSIPDNFFRIQFIAGPTLGTRVFETVFTVSTIFNGGAPVFATFTDDSIAITVVPGSSVVSLLVISAAGLWRRRRCV